MNIVIVTGNYPINFAPNHGAFVYNLVQELAKNNKITIVSSLKAHHWHKYAMV